MARRGLELVRRASDRKGKREEGDDKRDPPVRERRREGAGGLPPSWAGAQAGPRGALGRGEEKKEEGRSGPAGVWAEREEEKGRRKKELFPDGLEFGKFWRNANEFELKLQTLQIT